jgi:Flp pilus assembly protein TadG
MVVTTPQSKRRHGVATVEFAVVIIPLMIILFGVWEVGRMLEVQQLLTNAAREGGRAASTGTNTIAQIKTVVEQYLAVNQIVATDSDVTVANLTSGKDPNQSDQMDHLRVTVTVKWSDVQWTPVSLLELTGVDKLQGSSDWYSMRDIPIAVNQNIPSN